VTPYLFAGSALVCAAVALSTRNRLVRVVCGLTILILLAGSLTFAFQAAARRTMDRALENGTYSQQYADGAIALLQETLEARLLIAICGLSLFAIAAFRRKSK
jgi:hypothetical protein